MKLEQQYKQTELGELPVDWKVVELENCLTLLRNGITKKQNKAKKGLPVSRIETISTSRINPNKVGFINGLSEKEIEKYKLIKEDILFSHINSEPYLGNSAIYENEPKTLIHGMNLLLFRTKKEILNPKFLNFLFNYYRIKGIFIGISSRAVNQSSINQGKIKKLKIPLPPLPEQKKIAYVLSTIQTAIQKTDHVINSYKELKKSMMKHLFTYGPVSLEEAEKIKLKETEIGMINEEWEIKKISEICYVVMGQSPPGNTYNLNEGIPFLQGKAEFGYFYPKNIKFTTNPIKIGKKGSVLMSVRAPVGDVNIADKDYCIGRGLCSISMKNNQNTFLYYSLIFRKSDIEDEGTGSTFKAINKSKIEQFKLAIPNSQTQQQIASILSAIDNKIQAETNRKKSLEVLFKSMLHNLMSAKIRVNGLDVNVD